MDVEGLVAVAGAVVAVLTAATRLLMAWRAACAVPPLE